MAQQTGAIRLYCIPLESSSWREEPESWLRPPTRPPLEMRNGPRSLGVFCTGRLIWKETSLWVVNKRSPEGDKPICWASQTVNVTVNATANPVHLLLRLWVTLGLAKCTN